MLRQDKLEAEHLNAIVDVTKSTFYHQKLKESKYFIEIASKINSLAQKEDVSKIYKTLVNKLDLLFKSIDSTTDFVGSLSHGDFTPWNMYRSEGKLHLYDLEASSFAPALVDLFHFIVQSEVLLKGNSFKKIQNQIQNLHDEPKLAALIQDYKIDTQLHLQLYLLHSVSTQVLKYIEQDEELHVQSHWLIESWSVLLDYVIVDGKKQSMREQFLESFAEEMSTVKYVWLKSFEKKIVSLAEESDIDLLIDKNDLNSVIKQLRKFPYVAKVDLFNYKHMKTVRLFFKDATSISLDYIFSFERKARKLMSINNILSDRVLTEEGIFVPQIKYDLEFTILFYLSNEANVPKKHSDYFLSLNGDQKKSLIRYMNDKYRLNFSDLNSFLIYSQDYKKHLDKEIDKKKQNKIWLKSLRWFGYTFYVFKNLFHRKGIVVSISGVDGAGKSTLINALKHQLQKRLRQEVVVLRHRPCVLPILSSFKHGKKKAEKLASVTMPRQGRNNSNLSSWLRFAYYYLDYLFGQIYVYLRYTLLGKVVIYDRYYFDFINDPERSNIRLKGNIVKKLYAFIRKPEINILLYASPEVILQRKQELSKEDIEILTDKYITCFQDLANGAKDTGYHPVRNDVFEDTLERTVGLCLATI
jgi:thymidylate kinase